MNRDSVFNVVCCISAVLLAIGCFRLPIGYYTFLRIIIFVASLFILTGTIKNKMMYSTIATILVAVLFNPFFPIYLHSKSIWIILDLLSAAWFVYCAIKKRIEVS